MFEDFLYKLKKDKYYTIEVTPPHEPSIEEVINNILSYNFLDKIAGFTTTDSPLAKLKYNSILASIKIQQTFKKPSIATISMRDRNKIALQSDILGGNDFDIRAILALTGDPATMSDQPHTKGVFESNSNLLLEIIQSFNNNLDYRGKNFKIKPKPIYPFAVTNSYAKNFKSLEKRIIKKVNLGAIGIITQPIYDIEIARKLLDFFKYLNSTLIFGFFPITKLSTARFLSSQVPGIYVHGSWVDKLSKASKISQEEEFKVGFELSVELFKKLNSIHPKIHIMSANKFKLINNILTAT